MKQLKTMFILSILGAFLIGCGTSNLNEPTTGSGGKSVESNKEDGYIVQLEAVNGQKGTFIFAIKNVGKEPMNLTFPTSQTFDFALKDDKGETLYQYGHEHFFLQVITEKVLEVDSQLEMEIYIEDIIENFEPGTYSLQVWLKANNLYAEITKELIIE